MDLSSMFGPIKVRTYVNYIVFCPNDYRNPTSSIYSIYFFWGIEGKAATAADKSVCGGDQATRCDQSWLDDCGCCTDGRSPPPPPCLRYIVNALGLKLFIDFIFHRFSWLLLPHLMIIFITEYIKVQSLILFIFFQCTSIFLGVGRACVHFITRGCDESIDVVGMWPVDLDGWMAGWGTGFGSPATWVFWAC